MVSLTIPHGQTYPWFFTQCLHIFVVLQAQILFIDVQIEFQSLPSASFMP